MNNFMLLQELFVCPALVPQRVSNLRTDCQTFQLAEVTLNPSKLHEKENPVRFSKGTFMDVDSQTIARHASMNSIA